MQKIHFPFSNFSKTVSLTASFHTTSKQYSDHNIVRNFKNVSGVSRNIALCVRIPVYEEKALLV